MHIIRRIPLSLLRMSHRVVRYNVETEIKVVAVGTLVQLLWG